MKVLKIKWQRLVSEGETCPRCGGTEEELKKAVEKLKKTFSPLGIQIDLQKKKISLEEFEKKPLKSNVIYIEDKPLEKWIGGEVGQSQCCEVCGPNDCRTTRVDGKVYETIPSELIVKASLRAASNLIDNENNSCCDNESSNNSSCC